MTVVVRPRESNVRCVLCHAPEAGDLVACERCAARFHADCRGPAPCPTLGCAPAVTIAPRTSDGLVGWILAVVAGTALAVGLLLLLAAAHR